MQNHFNANNIIVLSGVRDAVIQTPDPFGRDVSWITLEIIETYAAFCLRGDDYAESEGLALCGHDKAKFSTLQSIYHDGNKQFVQLKERLLAQYGANYFQPLMSIEELLRLTESVLRRAARSKDYATVAELIKHCRELRELRDELG